MQFGTLNLVMEAVTVVFRKIDDTLDFFGMKSEWGPKPHTLL